jgi:hypothetical protein
MTPLFGFPELTGNSARVAPGLQGGLAQTFRLTAGFLLGNSCFECLLTSHNPLKAGVFCFEKAS